MHQATRAAIRIAIADVLAFLVISTAFPANASGLSQDTVSPGVVLAVAPLYPPLALSSDTTGDVVVEANIASDGDVHSTHIVSGYPVLRENCERTARQWKFEAEPNVQNRTLQLTFSFRTAPKGTHPLELTARFEPPYRVTVTSVVPEGETT